MEIVQKYINSYRTDMDLLNITRPNIEPQATSYINEQIELVRDIIDKGFGYIVNGSVYFNVRKYNDTYKSYGQLSGRKIDDLLSETRDLNNQNEKEDNLDFALWKKADDNHIMKLKNIKNSILIVNGIWICKGTDDIEKERNKILNQLTKEVVYNYITDIITDKNNNIFVTDGLEKFKILCKKEINNSENINDTIFKHIKDKENENLKVKKTTTLFGKSTLTPDYGKGLLGYINCINVKKIYFTIDLEVKKNIVTLFIKDILEKRLKIVDNQEDLEKIKKDLEKIKEDCLNILNERFRTTIENDENIKNLIINVEKKIKTDKPVDKPVEDKTKKEEEKKTKEEEEKEKIKNKNNKLNEDLNNLIKTGNYKTIKSNELRNKLDDIKNVNFTDGFTITKIDEKNKNLILQIEKEIKDKGTKEMEDKNKNKNKNEEQLKNKKKEEEKQKTKDDEEKDDNDDKDDDDEEDYEGKKKDNEAPASTAVETTTTEGKCCPKKNKGTATTTKRKGCSVKDKEAAPTADKN